MEEFAMTTRTGKLLLALSAAMILGGCDPIEALPPNYESPIAVVGEGDTKVDVYENMMGVLFDGTTSNKKDDVLSNFINIIAEDQFGKYSDIKALVEENNDANIAAFIANHKNAYVHDNKVNDGDNEVEEDAYLAAKYNTTVAAIQKQRLVNFYNSVKDKINEAFYNEIVGKSYNDDTGKFHEQRLAYAHYASLYDVNINAATWYEGYLTPELKKDDVSSFIHLDDGRYDDYINRSLVRNIYKDKLVEEYLLANNYSTLGRAYGRKVNIIKLTRDEKYKDLPNTLLNKYAELYVHAGQDIDFETVANAWRGFHGIDKDGNIVGLSANEEALLEACGLVKVTKNIDGVTYKYFKETKYGQLIERYSLIDEDNRYASEEANSALQEFTSSLKYTKEKGLKIKLAELALSDYTTDGWYVKNGGLTDLPEAIRNRLFNINVSKEVDNVDPATYEYAQTDYTKYIKGHYYLTPATSEAGDENNFIIYDDGSFYMIEVEEAVSTSKLNIDGSASYVELKTGVGALFTEEIARELAATLGTKDSYVNNAYASYIEKYAVMYHDTSVLDFFKEKFPELFDEEE